MEAVGSTYLEGYFAPVSEEVTVAARAEVGAVVVDQGLSPEASWKAAKSALVMVRDGM